MWIFTLNYSLRSSIEVHLSCMLGQKYMYMPPWWVKKICSNLTGSVDHILNLAPSPRNINWQDWTFDVTMHFTEKNLLRTSSKTLDWNSNFQSIYFYIDIESNVLHRSVSYWESLSCKNFVNSSGLNFNPMFSTTSATS